MFNIIGDVAGRFDELMDLLALMPKDCITILVGDIMDRGPKSKEVIEWAMKESNEGRLISIYGNHEDMMVDCCLGLHEYQTGIWTMNGGYQTLQSYGATSNMNLHEAVSLIPELHLEWIRTRPKYFKSEDGLIVTHAPLFSTAEVLSQVQNDTRFLWNRHSPERREGKFQVFGHNASFYKVGKPNEEYAICIDNSGDRELMGMHWPSKDLFKVPYKDIIKEEEEE